jgi:hypothetical protein
MTAWRRARRWWGMVPRSRSASPRMPGARARSGRPRGGRVACAVCVALLAVERYYAGDQNAGLQGQPGPGE